MKGEGDEGIGSGNLASWCEAIKEKRTAEAVR
jgi:hypothetical protein